MNKGDEKLEQEARAKLDNIFDVLKLKENERTATYDDYTTKAKAYDKHKN
ncbi:MAG: hypothetical protein WHU54_04720 [Candidatus Bathyarchaeia archaeon]|jgi:hypothetical protein